MNVEYVETSPGKSPALEFLTDELSEKDQGKLLLRVDELKKKGMLLLKERNKFQKVTNTDDLYELKANGNRVILRFLIVVADPDAWIVHGFKKKDQTILQKHITTALERRVCINDPRINPRRQI